MMNEDRGAALPIVETAQLDMMDARRLWAQVFGERPEIELTTAATNPRWPE